MGFFDFLHIGQRSSASDERRHSELVVINTNLHLVQFKRGSWEIFTDEQYKEFGVEKKEKLQESVIKDLRSVSSHLDSKGVRHGRTKVWGYTFTRNVPEILSAGAKVLPTPPGFCMDGHYDYEGYKLVWHRKREGELWHGKPVGIWEELNIDGTVKENVDNGSISKGSHKEDRRRTEKVTPHKAKPTRTENTAPRTKKKSVFSRVFQTGHGKTEERMYYTNLHLVKLSKEWGWRVLTDSTYKREIVENKKKPEKEVVFKDLPLTKTEVGIDGKWQGETTLWGWFFAPPTTNLDNLGPGAKILRDLPRGFMPTTDTSTLGTLVWYPKSIAIYKDGRATGEEKFLNLDGSVSYTRRPGLNRGKGSRG